MGSTLNPSFKGRCGRYCDHGLERGILDAGRSLRRRSDHPDAGA